MKVTDEMVTAALDFQPWTSVNNSVRMWQLMEEEGIEPAAVMRELLAEAISHAAGQEVVAFRYLMQLGFNSYAWTRWLEMDQIHRAEGSKIEYAYSRPSAEVERE